MPDDNGDLPRRQRPAACRPPKFSGQVMRRNRAAGRAGAGGENTLRFQNRTLRYSYRAPRGMWYHKRRTRAAPLTERARRAAVLRFFLPAERLPPGAKQVTENNQTENN